MIDYTFTDDKGRSAFESFSLFVQNVQIQESDLAKAGEWMVERRLTQTLSGLDVDGNNFAFYSPRYAFRKKSSNVTLRSSGKGPHMLDALTFRVPSISSLEIGIFDDSELATRAAVQNEGAEIRTRSGTGLEGHLRHPGRKKLKGISATLTIPARHWLGASTEDLIHMEEIIAESVLERAEKA